MEDKTFFYPNCCHVCKRWDVPLMSCAKCQMISYCNEKHQREHLPHHRDICEAIKRVLEDKEYMNTEEISTKTWINIRHEYLNKVSAILQRDLKMEEIEMFQFPKSCVVCHRQDAVIGCNDCPSATFCDTHRNDSEHRRIYCKLLKESFEVDKCCALTESIDISYVNRVFNETTFNDMKSFLATCLPPAKNNVYLRMLHSNEVTDPLTIYFCMKKLDYLKCEMLSVHIIGPDVISAREDLKIWKMLLTLIPTLTTLTITFIQKRIAFFHTEVVKVSETKKLVANMRYMSYEEYVDATDFQKPNFIVGFNADVANNMRETNEYGDISERSGKVLAEQQCPCILIFDYTHEINLEMLNHIEKNFFGENPFKNLMLCRHFETERVYYPNNNLIIFNDLDSIKIITTTRNKCVLFVETTRE